MVICSPHGHRVAMHSMCTALYVSLLSITDLQERKMILRREKASVGLKLGRYLVGRSNGKGAISCDSKVLNN